MTIMYKFNLDGAKLAWRHLCNKFNGNDKLIDEYFVITGILFDAAKAAKGKTRRKKLHRAYNELSESKVVPMGGNKFDLQFYNAPAMSRAQNYAKVVQGRAMLGRLGLCK